jgi:predicted Zn finger-like uncharacterized protein
MPNLAARCSACGTVFRVVQDQLRVAGGLVRCGRCGEVFNAAEALIDLETSAPIAAPPEHADPEPEPLREPEPAPPPKPLLDAGTRFDLDTAQAVSHGPTLPPLTAAEPHSEEPEPVARTLADPPPIDPRAESDDRPSFVRSADRAQRWREPRVRATLAAVALLGAVGLAAQLAHTWRDALAVRFPATRPALEAACTALGCRVEAVRAIDKLAVESSGLVRVEKSSVYKLQVTLRNRSDIPLAFPAFDLSLSDSAGKPLARRVLRAADLGVNMATLAAGREVALQATLQAATEPVAGYTIELFYP